VAHVCQKVALGTIRRFRTFFRELQRLFGTKALGNVSENDYGTCQSVILN
jgi:hypothetical protein